MQPLRGFLSKIFFNFLYLFGEPPWDTGISPPELMAFIAEQPPGRALDLGCGTGTNVITLARHDWQVTGVDFVGRAIETARRKAKKAGVQAEFHVDDVTRLEGVAGPFDLVLDIGCLHSLAPEAKTRYIDNLGSLLAPGGFFLVYGFLQGPEASGQGLSPSDLHALEADLALLDRQDGTERGIRPSVWLKYRQAG